MACFHPLQAFRTVSGDIVFEKLNSVFSTPLKLPCSQCVGCRLERSRQWAIRCVHEATLHQSSCFITLTFNNDHLPNPPNLNVRDFQLFMKRLRKRLVTEYYNTKLKKLLGRFKLTRRILLKWAAKRIFKIRFYHCGEYGEKFGRPHYHALIFGYDFPDKYKWMVRKGKQFYRSPMLEELWPFGNSDISDVTFQSAAYVARYIMKKINGDMAEEYYSFVPQTGEVFKRKPEYTTMSRRPGIGSDWIKKYLKDTYKDDTVIMNGKELRPPKFYDNIYEISHPDEMQVIKSIRKSNAVKHQANNTPERLRVREQVTLAHLRNLTRTVDSEA